MMPRRSYMGLRVGAIVLALAAAVPIARAGDDAAASPPVDKSGFTLFDPTPDSALRAFTPDRPTRSTSPITVDAGHFQIESDFLNYSGTQAPGLSLQSFVAADPLLKLGITNFADLEVALGGYTHLRSRTDGVTTRGSGFGDVTVQSKINLLGNDGGTIAFALEPYLVIPSGTRNISAGQVEGGVLAPLQLTLPSDFTVILQTEVDALANTNGPGTHAAFTNIVNLSHEIPGIKDLTGSIEFYTQLDTERHTDDTYTFDLALAYLVTPDLQLDIGANLGLSRGAPDEQVYGGVAHRF